MILVTGGAGVMGSRLVKGLVGKGHQVRVLTLPGDPKADLLKDIDCEIVYGDVSDASTLKGIFFGIDTVYHLAAIIIAYNKETLLKINVEGTRNVVNQAIENGCRHFIYISSAAAEWPDGSDYAQSKIAAEEIVKSQNKMNYTIVRPTLTYGYYEGQEFMMFLDSLKRYPFVFFIGNGHAKKKPVLADDIVKGLMEIAGNDKTFGKTYNFSGSEEISMWDFARALLEYEKIKKPFIAVPIPICNFIAAIMEKTMKKPFLTRYGISRILHEAAFDNSEAQKDLGYFPLGVRRGLEKIYKNR
ncbi:MAG: NAD-dependent epimerase/dehydratase family protein [Candidatus Humimicrobiaceae bacterium]